MLESNSSSQRGNTTTLERDDDRIPFDPQPWNGPRSNYEPDEDEDYNESPQAQQPNADGKNTTWERCDDLPQRPSGNDIPDSFPTMDDFQNFYLQMREGGEVYHFGINPDGIRIIGMKENCELMVQALDWIASHPEIQRDGLSFPDFIRDSQLRTLITAKLNAGFRGFVGGIAPIGQTNHGNLVSYGIAGINPDQSLAGAIFTIIHECDHLRGFDHDVMNGRDRQMCRDMERAGMKVTEGYDNR